MLRRSCSPGLRAVWFEHILQVFSPVRVFGWLACFVGGPSGCLAQHTQIQQTMLFDNGSEAPETPITPSLSAGCVEVETESKHCKAP